MTIDAKRLAIINKVLELNSEEIRMLHAHVTNEKTDKEVALDIITVGHGRLSSIREIRNRLEITLRAAIDLHDAVVRESLD